MDTRLTNYQVLEGWLNYLQEIAEPLVGTQKDKMLKLVEGQGLLQRERYYLLECPLQGEAGIDFSLAYKTEDFLGTRDYTGNTGFRFARFFSLYANIVGPNKDAGLEFDTSDSRDLHAAVFVDMHHEQSELLLQKALAWQAETRRTPIMKSLLTKGKAMGLEPAYLGFMYSRLNSPLRLTFCIPQEILRLPDRYDEFAYFVQNLEIAKQSDVVQQALAMGKKQIHPLFTSNIMLQDLTAFADMDFVDCVLDIDIMPDGRIGDTFGIEIKLAAHTLEQQRKMLNSKEFAEFMQLLEEWNVVDRRTKCFKNCVFYAELPQALGHQEYLISMLSHFKLRYCHNKRLPAKVYLQGNRG